MTALSLKKMLPKNSFRDDIVIFIDKYLIVMLWIANQVITSLMDLSLKTHKDCAVAAENLIRYVSIYSGDTADHRREVLKFEMRLGRYINIIKEKKTYGKR